MSLHCSLFKPLPWSASSLVGLAKNFSNVISTKRLCLIHYGSQKPKIIIIIIIIISLFKN